MKTYFYVLIIFLWQGSSLCSEGQGPRLTTPTGGKSTQRNAVAPETQPVNPFIRLNYPWHKNITVSVFWVGEQPTARNPTPNCASSWDRYWMESFGGYDNPDPNQRNEYLPKGFIPQQNPFYIALPYNDCINHKLHKPEASSVIPWFRRVNPKPGKTSCKGRWIKIVQNKKVCYAQWEDCGPFFTDDWMYVFRNSKPKNKQNKNAGLDISPAVRDYMKIKSGSVVHWRFIDFADVPKVGPWTLYGTNNPFRDPKQDPDYEAKVKYMKYIKKLRSNYKTVR